MTQTVTVYTRPNCQPCRATQRWLREHGVAFEEQDATTPENTEALRYLGYQQAPVVFVSNGNTRGEAHWSGFNPVALNFHLNSSAA